MGVYTVKGLKVQLLDHRLGMLGLRSTRSLCKEECSHLLREEIASQI